MKKKVQKRSLRWWLSSGRTLTTLSLIILPLITVIIQLLFDSISPYQFYEEYNYYRPVSTNIIPVLQYIIFVLIIVLYPPYPAPIESTEKYFADRGFQTAVEEYEFVKKILYFVVPFLIFLYLIPYILPAVYHLIGEQNPVKTNQLNPALSPFLGELDQPGFKLLKQFLFLIVLAGLLKLVFAIARKKFRLFYAKGCLEISLYKADDEIEKMSYIVKGLSSYNTYLRRLLNHEMRDLDKIYSKLAASTPSIKNELVAKIYESLKNEKPDVRQPGLSSDSLRLITKNPTNTIHYSYGEQNTLRPLIDLSEFLYPDKPKKLISLTEQSVITKIKDWGTFAAAIIPVGVMIIELSLKATGTFH